MIIQGRSAPKKKNRSAIRSNILKKLCNGNVEQLDITARGSPVILLNHVFWGKIDHRTMNDNEDILYVGVDWKVILFCATI